MFKPVECRVSIGCAQWVDWTETGHICTFTDHALRRGGGGGRRPGVLDKRALPSVVSKTIFFCVLCPTLPCTSWNKSAPNTGAWLSDLRNADSRPSLSSNYCGAERFLRAPQTQSYTVQFNCVKNCTKNLTECSLAEHRFPITFVNFFGQFCVSSCTCMVDKNIDWGNCGIPWVNCAVLCLKDDWKGQFLGLRYCLSKLRSLLSFSVRYDITQ